MNKIEKGFQDVFYVITRTAAWMMGYYKGEDREWHRGNKELQGKKDY